jgi:hypothetical protein
MATLSALGVPVLVLVLVLVPVLGLGLALPAGACPGGGGEPAELGLGLGLGPELAAPLLLLLATREKVPMLLAVTTDLEALSCWP